MSYLNLFSVNLFSEKDILWPLITNLILSLFITCPDCAQIIDLAVKKVKL